MAEAVWTVEVQWADCDAAGVVFYPNYFKWFDASCHHLFTALGYSHRRLEQEFSAVGLMLVDAQASYRHPSSFGDTLTVRTEVSDHSARRINLTHRIHCGATLICEGREVRVFAVRSTDGSVSAAPLPAGLLERLG